MKRMSDTIVFFCSGPVAAKSLELLNRNFNIEAVITKPQPEHHQYVFPVIETAAWLNLKLLYAETKQELSALVASSGLKSKAGVVIDYGIIISKTLLITSH